MKRALQGRNIQTIASIWRQNLLGYLSADILFSEQIISAGKYVSIFSRQMEAIVYIFSRQMEAILYIFSRKMETIVYIFPCQMEAIRLQPYCLFIIHQIFSLAGDWSIRVT